jgi:hypothetical protein
MPSLASVRSCALVERDSLMTIYLRFKDLRARNIVRNYTTLQRWIEKRGFPPGIWPGANTHAWAEDEIEAWLAAQPKKKPRRKNGGGDAG